MKTKIARPIGWNPRASAARSRLPARPELKPSKNKTNRLMIVPARGQPGYRAQDAESNKTEVYLPLGSRRQHPLPAPFPIAPATNGSEQPPSTTFMLPIVTNRPTDTRPLTGLVPLAHCRAVVLRVARVPSARKQTSMKIPDVTVLSPVPPLPLPPGRTAAPPSIESGAPPRTLENSGGTPRAIGGGVTLWSIKCGVAASVHQERRRRRRYRPTPVAY